MRRVGNDTSPAAVLAIPFMKSGTSFFLLLFLLLSIHPVDADDGIKSVTADDAQKGHPAAHAFDQDSQTRWASKGRGRWIQCELYDAIELSKIGLGFEHSERNYRFEIETSIDGQTWKTVPSFESKGRGGVHWYEFPENETRFLRITVHGSNQNDWANIHTIHIPGVSPPLPDPSKSPTAGFAVTEWANDPAIAHGVALSIDDQGQAYVTNSIRRKKSSLDIRQHQKLVKKDLSFQTVEERRAFYREYLTDQPWLVDRNGDGTKDWQDLTVQKDKVTRVSDLDGDGSAESIRILGEYHSEVTGIAAGVLAVEKDVFVAAEPDFLRYTDEDGDGFPETETVVATGFQVHMGQGGHNLSGVTLGPDGRVYWSLADKGHFVQTKEGRTYHRPNSGGIFRCELDGSNVDRYSTGERNAQELAFDAFGNLFSMDNDGDYPGEMERALYITEGSEHGWRLNWQWLGKQDFTRISGLKPYNPWMDEKLYLPDNPDHAAYLTPTIGNFGPGPCGFAANPGTALSPALAQCFFMTNQQNQVRVFQFKPKGAFFSYEELPPIKGGVGNTGLAIGPDGALYSTSWGGNKGFIFRFDVSKEDRHPARDETQKILASPAADAALETLQTWLAHPDQRVRIKGQFELVRRGPAGIAVLADTLSHDSQLARLHAIWGLGQAARRQPELIAHLAPAWQSDDPEVHAQAIKVVGDLGTRTDRFLDELRAGLEHESVRVQFFAAISLGNREDSSAGPG
ncbi:MAG: discoidin domain-containing protein, partial [Verrucomicrobiota bacterium]